MRKLVSKTGKIIERMKKEGRVTSVKLSDETMKKLSENMERIMIESRRKQNESWAIAKNIILD